MGDHHPLAGRRALVLGGGGFIGSHLCGQLVRVGADVHATSRQRRDDEDGIRWLSVDVAELDTVRDAFRRVRPELVFHLASHVAGARDIELVQPTLYGNLIGTVNVLTAAQEAGSARIVLAGSMEEPTPEDQTVASSPYAVAKWAASGYARMFHALYDSPVVTLRIFMVYGPGQQDLRKLVPHVALSLLRGERPRLTSGSRAIDWIYVEDVVSAFLEAASREGLAGETVDVGSGTRLTIHDLVDRLAAIIDSEIEPIFGALPDRPLETTKVADLERTWEILGWRPAVPLDEGLRRTVDWFAREGIEVAEPLPNLCRERMVDTVEIVREEPVGQSTCRLCETPLVRTFVDLGNSPLCESFLTAEQLDEVEHFYPLHVRICEDCLLVQLEAYVSAEEIFPEYAYFSAYSDSWVEHARRVHRENDRALRARPGQPRRRAGLERRLPAPALRPSGDPRARHRPRGERRGGRPRPGRRDDRRLLRLPSRSAARRRGPQGRPRRREQRPRAGAGPQRLRRRDRDHSRRRRGGHDRGAASRAADRGAPVRHDLPRALLVLLADDTGASLRGARARGLRRRGAAVARWLAPRVREAARRPGSEVGERVGQILELERAGGYDRSEGYGGFSERVAETRWRLLELLIGLKREGKSIVGYGAPGKGNTLLNYCGIRTDLLDYTVDRNPYKHGKFLPGTHIPIYPPERIEETRPDYILILPWNLHQGDRRTALVCPRMGRPADRSHSAPRGARIGLLKAFAMKVVLFCGGLGLRMGETSSRVPKPMIPVGDRPILWHIMKYYASFGFTDFILCLGYKAEVIKEYFLSYNEALSNDFVLRDGGKQHRAPGQRHPRLVDDLRQHRAEVADRPAPEEDRTVS